MCSLSQAVRAKARREGTLFKSALYDMEQDNDTLKVTLTA